MNNHCTSFSSTEARKQDWPMRCLPLIGQCSINPYTVPIGMVASHVITWSTHFHITNLLTTDWSFKSMSVIASVHFQCTSSSILTALLVWKSVHGSPAYRSNLRSTASAMTGSPHAWNVTVHWSFAINGSTTWNSLPPASWSPHLS